MSVTFTNKPGSIRAGGWDSMDSDYKSEYGGRFPKSVWWIGAAAVCLGLLYLLLLIIIIAMVAQHIGPTLLKDTEQLLFSAIRCDNLTSQCFQLQSRYNTLLERNNQLEIKLCSLTKEKDTVTGERDTLQNERDTLQNERDTLRDERDHLKLVSSNLTKELAVLQNRFNTVVESRDGLKEEAQELNQNRTEKLCPSHWVKFQEKCYYISKKGKTLSWQASRRDCKDRGGDLVIITTRQEQNFVTAYYDRIWIGLSDSDQEGKWKWVNGEELDFKGFWQKGEPNDSDGDENCVEVSHSGRGWNDMPCHEQLSWVCED
ncbi:C-type lectin domain family 4 member M-like [Dunckerocampus dactyliophorus]|uniref:C-type lectin domain family 4 member M-like n=1 Tax=Dunckerocampus dactyliophorus TaxID=161453 RepID=UPI002406FF56|nr:C-type lectin domain family 4 member M-like [Dunckerocampus dactyliophorus]XP_054637885.1 C-type lectin domain family 4 member M-like [Dunckerocampus dactyliophorus]